MICLKYLPMIIIFCALNFSLMCVFLMRVFFIEINVYYLINKLLFVYCSTVCVYETKLNKN